MLEMTWKEITGGPWLATGRRWQRLLTSHHMQVGQGLRVYPLGFLWELMATRPLCTCVRSILWNMVLFFSCQI